MNRTGRWLAAAALALQTAAVSADTPPPPVQVISRTELGGTIKGRRGRPLLLHVWASWCQPCVRELPVVADLLRAARARGLDVYSVSLDEPSERATQRMRRVLRVQGGDQINLTILRMDDPDAAVAQIDPDWEGDIPAFFAYDRSGKLRRAHVGEMTREKFDRLVAGLVPPVKN
jgi:thiol-disulfide isomerase/thioredoxin